MMSRFRPPPGDNDRRVLDRVQQVKITLFRGTDGVQGSFELTGELGDEPEEFFGGPMQADGLELLKALIERFGQAGEQPT